MFVGLCVVEDVWKQKYKNMIFSLSHYSSSPSHSRVGPLTRAPDPPQWRQSWCWWSQPGSSPLTLHQTGGWSPCTHLFPNLLNTIQIFSCHLVVWSIIFILMIYQTWRQCSQCQLPWCHRPQQAMSQPVSMNHCLDSVSQLNPNIGLHWGLCSPQ